MCRIGRVKLTGPLERVLRVFLADVSARHYGYDLMKAARLPSGTLYPMLARLEDEGLVSSEWEPRAEDGAGRPPRKYYRLTGEGARVARLQLAQAAPAGRRAAARAAWPFPPRTAGESTR
jgi:PadR family transcriptional regulator, regulatory protein PadR